MTREIPSTVTDHHFTSYSGTGHVSIVNDRHYHSWIEVYRLTEGVCQYFVDDTIYDLVPGDILLIPPYHTHKNYYSSTPYSRSVLHIGAAYVPPFALELFEKKEIAYRIPEISEEISELVNKIE